MPSHCDHWEAVQLLGVVVAAGAELVVFVVTGALVVEVMRVVEGVTGTLVLVELTTALLLLPPAGGEPNSQSVN